MTNVFTLNQLIHASWDGKSSLKLYVFDHDGFHRGGQWFADTVRYPDEEITTAEAMELIAAAIADKREVRVCDGGDFLVFHSTNGQTVYDGGFISPSGLVPRQELKYCPRCGADLKEPLIRFCSRSRRDGQTFICNKCGDAEAFEDANMQPPYKGPQYWKAVKP